MKEPDRVSAFSLRWCSMLRPKHGTTVIVRLFCCLGAVLVTAFPTTTTSNRGSRCLSDSRVDGIRPFPLPSVDRQTLLRLRGGGEPNDSPTGHLSSTYSSLDGAINSNDLSQGALRITSNSTPQVDGSSVITPVPTSKSLEEMTFLRQSLTQNVMFSKLPSSILNALIDAFDLTTYDQASHSDGVLYRQNDAVNDNNYVYLLRKGTLSVYKDGQLVPEPYGTLRPGAIIGQLGFLYNKPRSATIRLKDEQDSEQVTLYRIPGETFKKIMHYEQDEERQQLEQITTRNEREEPTSSDVDRLIDDAIRQVEGTKTLYDGDIIPAFKPNRSWLWKQWRGTVLERTFVPTLLNMTFAYIFVLIARRIIGSPVPFWHIFGLPPHDPNHPFIQRLISINKIWKLQMSLTTFILTFFVNQAYAFWYELYGITRRIQGRLNDFSMMCATAAQRTSDGRYTKQARTLLNDVAASSRLFHIIMWASCAKRFRILRTNIGLERMANRGLMTSQQLQTLLEMDDVPENQRQCAPLQWMMILCWEALENGTLRGDIATSQRLMDILCTLRATYATIGDKVSCRMPLVYTHFVQVLVDSFVLIAPIALYPEMGGWCIVATGLLTVFYTGLMDIAKIFLDPLNNESYSKSAMYMDLGVLIRESNAGSIRWKNSAARLPWKR